MGREAPPGTVRAGPRALDEAGDKRVMWLGQRTGPKTHMSALLVLISLLPTAQGSTAESEGREDKVGPPHTWLLRRH